MRSVLISILLLGIPSAFAEDFVCSNGGTGFVRYVHSIDPSRISDPNCLTVREGKIPAQQQLIAAVPAKYLTVQSGLAVEMSQADKDAVDVAEATATIAAAKPRNDARAELLTKGFTQATVETLLP